MLQRKKNTWELQCRRRFAKRNISEKNCLLDKIDEVVFIILKSIDGEKNHRKNNNIA